MEENDVHSGIPLGHKVLAALVAAGVAAAGWAWLIDQSRTSASTAVLAFNPELAGSVDPGIVSAQSPAVALADSRLDDQAVAKLAKQVPLASSTPAAQVGEFRSDLQLSQPSALRLDVRFHAARASQSIAAANAVAHALADWVPASGIATAPPAPLPSATPPASPVQQPAPTNQGQSRPSAAAAPASQPAPPSHALPDHPLSEAIGKLGAQLSATDQRVEQLAADGASDSESRQQSLLRVEVREAQKNLGSLRTQYATELAEPNIGGRLDEIQQALDSIFSGANRNGFYAAGVSASELRAERSELRQAIRIVGEETKKVQLAEAAQPVAMHSPNASAAPPPPETTSAQTASAPPTSPPAAGQTSPVGLQEQNIPATPAAGKAQQKSSASPLSIVRLAAPASRPPLWPALVAGAVCGLLYLGIAALAYRRTGSDYVDQEMSSAPQRMITPHDPIARDESATASSRAERFEGEERHRAAFDFQPVPGAKGGSPATNAAAPAEKDVGQEPAETPEPPAEAVTDSSADPSASGEDAAESGAAPEETDSVPSDVAGKDDQPRASVQNESPGEDRAEISSEDRLTGADPVIDPVAERIRKGIAETSIARSFENPDR